MWIGAQPLVRTEVGTGKLGNCLPPGSFNNETWCDKEKSMNFRKKKITKGMALTAALALFVGVGTLLADLPGFFANVFELGPGLGSDESGRTNILGDGNASNGPD